MQVVSIISTKGGVGKTTVAANLGAFIADAGLRVLLLDLDMQPTLSSYYELKHRAPGGIYELLAFNERDLANLVSRTVIDNLDLVLSNDEHRQLNTLLLHAPDGRLRLRNLMPNFQPHYDLVVIDTQARAAYCWKWHCWRPSRPCRPSHRKSWLHANCGVEPCNWSRTSRRTESWALNRPHCSC